MAGKRRDLQSVQRKLDGLLDAIAEGMRGETMQQKLDQLEVRRAELTREIERAALPAPRLHPNLAEIYRTKVEALQAALAGLDRAGFVQAPVITR